MRTSTKFVITKKLSTLSLNFIKYFHFQQLLLPTTVALYEYISFFPKISIKLFNLAIHIQTIKNIVELHHPRLADYLKGRRYFECDLSQWINWRGITLLNTINDILQIITHQKISLDLDHFLKKEQAGFRYKSSCVDHINML